MTFDPELDLALSRVIKAPRRDLWEAWTGPRQLEQWWVPAPGLCKVLKLELRPGGAFLTQYSEGRRQALRPASTAACSRSSPSGRSSSPTR